MLVTIENAHLRLTVDTLGAQMMSILSRDGCEYLWQGDPVFWSDRAPVLFPFIARLEKEQYQLDGTVYPMGIHGFAAQSEFAVEVQRDALVLTLHSTDVTKESYPFDFSLEITYRLVGSAIHVENRVVNKSTMPMHFALGGHPGFCVPMNGEGHFEDCYLEFSATCIPERIGFTEDTVLVNGQTCSYPLQDGKILPLQHSLFDEDAIILQNMAREVTLKSNVSQRCVTVSYPDMPHLGVWHWPHTDAPYVCIEPWTSLPGRSGVLEDIACRSDFIHLEPKSTWENIWTISFS